jgi:hypothetical protein
MYVKSSRWLYKSSIFDLYLMTKSQESRPEIPVFRFVITAPFLLGNSNDT